MRSSKYGPHQGKREIERRRKRAEKSNAKKKVAKTYVSPLKGGVKSTERHIPDDLWPQYSMIV